MFSPLSGQPSSSVTYGLPKAVSRCPEMVREGFREVSDGFRGVSEGFRRGFQTAGFRFQGLQRFESVVWNRPWFQRVQKKGDLDVWQVRTGMKKIVAWFVPRGGLGLSSTNGGVFLVSDGFQAYVGPMLGHKNSKRKKKSVGNLCLGILGR